MHLREAKMRVVAGIFELGECRSEIGDKALKTVLAPLESQIKDNVNAGDGTCGLEERGGWNVQVVKHFLDNKVRDSDTYPATMYGASCFAQGQRIIGDLKKLRDLALERRTWPGRGKTFAELSDCERHVIGGTIGSRIFDYIKGGQPSELPAFKLGHDRQTLSVPPFWDNKHLTLTQEQTDNLLHRAIPFYVKSGDYKDHEKYNEQLECFVQSAIDSAIDNGVLDSAFNEAITNITKELERTSYGQAGHPRAGSSRLDTEEFGPPSYEQAVHSGKDLRRFEKKE
jgi:hypothetical protein